MGMAAQEPLNYQVLVTTNLGDISDLCARWWAGWFGCSTTSAPTMRCSADRFGSCMPAVQVNLPRPSLQADDVGVVGETEKGTA
jgi:hypothetical protein